VSEAQADDPGSEDDVSSDVKRKRKQRQKDDADRKHQFSVKMPKDDPSLTAVYGTGVTTITVDPNLAGKPAKYLAERCREATSDFYLLRFPKYGRKRVASICTRAKVQNICASSLAIIGFKSLSFIGLCQRLCANLFFTVRRYLLCGRICSAYRLSVVFGRNVNGQGGP
jgi:hypothetical protein